MYSSGKKSSRAPAKARRGVKLVALALAAQALTPMAHAACNGAYRCNAVTIERIYPRVYGYTLVETSADETNLSCSATSSIYLRLDQPHASAGSDTHEAIFGLLLSAYFQGHAVTFIMQQSVNNYCKIEGVYLEQ